MSCPNFMKLDSQVYHIVDLDINDYKENEMFSKLSDDDLYVIIDDDYDNIMEQIIDELHNHKFGKNVSLYEYDRSPIDFNNSYGGRYLGTLEKRVNNKYTIEVHSCVTGGYYCGQSYDYVIEIKNETYNDIETYGSGEFEQCPNKRVVELARKLGERLEMVYDRHVTDRLVCSGIFSNGEAVYTKL